MSPRQQCCVKTLGGTVTPVSAALIHSQTPTPLNSINPQRSLAIFAPMLAPSPRLVLQRNDCVMAAYESGGARTGGCHFNYRGPRERRQAVRAKWTACCCRGLWMSLVDGRSTRHAVWWLNSESLSTLDNPPPPPSISVNDYPEWEVEKRKSLEEPDLFCMLNMACNLYSSECLIKSERKMKSHQPAHPFCCLLEGLFLC